MLKDVALWNERTATSVISFSNYEKAPHDQCGLAHRAPLNRATATHTQHSSLSLVLTTSRRQPSRVVPPQISRNIHAPATITKDEARDEYAESDWIASLVVEAET